VFGLDSEFSEEALVSRINSDLANDLGNLLARSLAMTEKYFKGEVPDSGAVKEIDLELKREVMNLLDQYTGLMDGLGFHKGLIAIWDVIGKLNRYIVTQEPWVLAKTDRERLSTVLNHLLESLKVISVLLWPFMPETSVKIQTHLGLEKTGEGLRLEDVRGWGAERSVRPVRQAPHLFPRIEAKEPDARVEKKEPPAKQGRQAESKLSAVSIEDFRKLDIRVGTITAAEPIKGAKKVLKLLVDIGEERTVVAGIAQNYPPDALIGRQVVLLANLQPATLMGVESQGMILAAGDQDGSWLLMPDRPTTPGSRVR
jgi:methionyl-tRNA synthetase